MTASGVPGDLSPGAGDKTPHAFVRKRLHFHHFPVVVMFESLFSEKIAGVNSIVTVTSRLLLPALLALTLVFPARAESLLIGGTGSCEPLMKRLCDEFAKLSPEVPCTLVSPPLGSAGALRALGVGKVDLAIIARPLKGAEKDSLGRNFELGETPFALVTQGGQRRQGFTLDELASVYRGELLTWDNGDPIRLVLRTRDDSETAQLRSMSPAMEQAVALAERREGMVYGNDDMDTLALLTRTPGSLGPGSPGLLRSSGVHLTALPINGVTPSLGNLKNGSYPWRKTLSVVLPATPGPTAVKFADFLRSNKASEVLRRNDYLPARP
jgi:phosphate transport system substrate-binding protein